MAGGEGTRLRPLTSNQPKPMVPIFNKPIMEYTVDLLKAHKITDIVMTLQFMPQMIRSYFGDGSDSGVNIIYAVEQEPLGTAGSVMNARYHLDETFIVISGDALTDIDLTALVKYHKKKKSMATIALKSVENPLEFGVVIANDQGQIERFLEKPTWGEIFSDTINTGIYVLEPEVFKYIPAGESVDFAKDVFPKILADGLPLYGYVTDAYWCDVGNYEQYVQAHQDVMKGTAHIKPPGIKMREDVWIGEGAYIDPAADIVGPVVVGQNARIERGARINEYSVIGNNVVMRAGAHCHRSIVWDNTYVGVQARLHGCVVGKNCDLRNGSSVAQGVVVGDECVIGEGATINHDVKIYPFKSVDSGAVINTSIIWETRGMRSLFGKDGVTGLVGVDLTPDLAVRLAMAYGTSLPKGSEVVLSGDVSGPSRMLKRAIIAGLNSTGINCRDLRVVPAPVNRFNIIAGQRSGGIHVQVSDHDPQMINIAFFDSHGRDIKEAGKRDIERYYYRGDFRRVFYTETGQAAFPARGREDYTDGLLKSVNVGTIARARFKVIIDYAFGSASLTFPAFLGALGCEVVSLNAHTEEDRLALSSEQLEEHLAQLERTVSVFKADLGILVNNSGERIHLVDDGGRRLSWTEALLVLVELMAKHGEKGKLALPLSVPETAVRIAAGHGRDVVRTKLSRRSLMEATERRGVIFGGTMYGGYIFSKFMPAFDAAVTFCRLLELLAAEGRPLSAVREGLPKSFMAQRSTFCLWEQKGMVMRKLIERSKDMDVEMLDGVKVVEDGGWVLVVPDPDTPVFQVYAEAPQQTLAEAKVDDMITYIRSIVV